MSPERDSTLRLCLDILRERNLFITGGAGTGKSTLVKELMSRYSEDGKNVIALGSTGVSAVNIGGLTLHSFFAFGISNDIFELAQYDRRNRKRLNELKKILEKTDLIVIDEISMVSAETMEMIRYRVENLQYGGKIVVVGDFFQLPPVRKRGERGKNLFSDRLYAFESDAWSILDFAVLELERVWRTVDESFAEILSLLREGRCESRVCDYLDALRGNMSIVDRDYTRLYGRNIEVDRMNFQNLSSLKSEEFAIEGELETRVPKESQRVRKWLELLPVPKVLRLKEGAPVLFTVNRWGRYFNGERGIVRSVEDEYIIVEKSDSYVRVGRHPFELPEIGVDEEGRPKMESVATYRQYPLKLAYAVTIHKSQGMSIESLVCNLESIFVPSQLYVAISRAIDPARLAIDYNGRDFGGYLRRVIRVDDRVKDYYASIEGAVSKESP